MSNLDNETNLARNSYEYAKALFEKTALIEQLARDEAIRTQDEENKAFKDIFTKTTMSEMLPLVKKYGDAVKRNVIATMLMNEAYGNLVAKQKALDIASNRIRLDITSNGI